MKLCVPFCQFSVFAISVVGALRQLGLFWTCQLVSAGSEKSGKLIAYPSWSSKVGGPLLEVSPKYEAPPYAVNPARSSLTVFADSVERRVSECSGRVE